MNTDPVTLTLPFLTWQGLNVLLAALGAAGATGLVWLMLAGAERDHPPKLESWFKPMAVVLGVVWIWLLGATLWGLWQVFNGVEGATLGQGSLGLGALIAAFLGAPFVIYGTWLRHKTQRLEQEGHMTDRINKAVEQLGAEKTIKEPDGAGKTVERTVPNIEVRMGAILSLERIAQDSTIHDKGRDHVRVMEILCAYIRENSNARKPRDFSKEERKHLTHEATERERNIREQQQRSTGMRGGAIREWVQNLPKPRADVQLALAVIGRRSPQQRKVEAAWPSPPEPNTIWPFDIPLPYLCDEPDRAAIVAFEKQLRVWLSKIKGYSGYRIDLGGSNLQAASFGSLLGKQTVFAGAFLNAARLEGAYMSGARLEGAIIIGASLQCATLKEASLQGAVLSLSWLEWANLDGARMEGAHLAEANIEGLTRASVNLEGTSLVQARMHGVNLAGAQTNSCTSISGARLIGAALRSMDYSDVAASDKQIKSAFGDESVLLPEGIDRPAHWPDWELPDYGEHAFDTEWRKWRADPDAYTPPKKPD